MHCLNLNKKTVSSPTPARYKVFVEFQLFSFKVLHVQGCQNALVTSFASSNSPVKRQNLITSFGGRPKKTWPPLQSILYILSESDISSSTSILFDNFGDSVNVMMWECNLEWCDGGMVMMMTVYIDGLRKCSWFNSNVHNGKYQRVDNQQTAVLTKLKLIVLNNYYYYVIFNYYCFYCF